MDATDVIRMLDVDIPELYAYWVLYGSTLLLTIVSVYGFFECRRAGVDAERGLELARRYGDPEVIFIAKIRCSLAKWFVVGFVLTLIASAIAMAAILFLPPPPPDTSLSNSIVRILIVLAFAAFWQGKKTSREMHEAIRRKGP